MARIRPQGLMARIRAPFRTTVSADYSIGAVQRESRGCELGNG